MTGARSLPDLLRGRGTSRAGTGVLVLSPEVARALGDDGPSSEAVPLYGSIDHSDGTPLIRAQSLEPGPDRSRIGVIGNLEAHEVPGDVLLLATSPPTATLDGLSLEIVLCDPSRYRDRVVALPGAATMAGKAAVVVGLGSVGSDIGARLVRLGVRVIGCDPDLLQVENLIRWGLPASLDHVGRQKARAWTELLRSTVPAAQIEAHAMDIVRESTAFDRLLTEARPDLLLVATDTADSRRTANAAAARHGVPTLFVGLSDGAASVRVEIVDDARRGPCHLCSTHAEGLSLPAGAAARGSLTPYATEPTPPPVAVSALPVDVALGAAVAARVAILLLAGADWRQYLRNGEQQGNVLFLALRPDFWLFEGAWDRLVYQPDRWPDCPACGAREEA